MHGSHKDYLAKGSVRSLPKGQMRNIKQMFDKKCDSSENIPVPGGTKSYVQKAGAKLDVKSNGKSPPRPAQPKWRQDVPEPSHIRQGHSPIRTAQIQENPPPQYSNYPVPSPRKMPVANSVPFVPVNTCPVHGDMYVSRIPMQKLGNIATGVAISNQGEVGSKASQVSKVIGKFESSEDTPKPLIPRSHSLRSKSPSPSRSHLSTSPKRSPVPVRRPHFHVQEHDEDHVYSQVWKAGSSESDSAVVNTRPVSVFERSKLFENSKPSSVTPVRPQAPVRQRSVNDDTPKTNSSNEVNVATKTDNEVIPNTANTPKIPLRPPVRQKSVNERSRQPSGSEKVENTNDLRLTLNQEIQAAVLQSPSKVPPPPPSKPPRTGAHDDYMKIKLEKDGDEKKVRIHEDTNTEEISKTNNAIEVSEGFKDKLKMFSAEFDRIRMVEDADSLKGRPMRPPPPRWKRKTKPRPFSIATDSISDFIGSEDSDYEEQSEGLHAIQDNSFYEQVPAENVAPDSEDFKHWDLPRSVHQEPVPLRRSLSAECVQKAVDDEGTCNNYNLKFLFWNQF